MITISLAPKRWHVMQPKVYRYMTKDHVDAFMDSGKLRLKRMPEFRTHPDEVRRDEQEGNVVARHENAAGSQVILISAVGHDAYLLCASTKPNMHAKFGEACFQISNTFGFACAIAMRIPQFREGLEGPCIYTDDLILDKDGGPDAEHFLPSEDGFKIGGVDQARAIQKMSGPEFFFKKRRKYEEESEYRFVWLLTGGIGPFVDIECPDARQFCHRVK